MHALSCRADDQMKNAEYKNLSTCHAEFAKLKASTFYIK